LEDAPKKALALFKGWDHRLEATSAPAALFEVWWMKHLRPALLARFAPNPTVRQLLLPGDVDRMLILLAELGSHWDETERDAMLLSTLSAGFAIAKNASEATPPPGNGAACTRRSSSTPPAGSGPKPQPHGMSVPCRPAAAARRRCMPATG